MLPWEKNYYHLSVSVYKNVGDITDGDTKFFSNDKNLELSRSNTIARFSAFIYIYTRKNTYNDFLFAKISNVLYSTVFRLSKVNLMLHSKYITYCKL